MSTSRNVFGLRISAILEILGGLILLALIDQFLGNADGFWDMNPHPFWLVVVFIAAQYGANEAVLAALFSTIMLLLVGEWPIQSADQDSFDYYYHLLINPIMWFIVGLAAGALTERHLRKTIRLQNELDDSRSREETITESYSFVKTRKEDLETQLAGRLTSSVQAYKAAKAVESLNPSDVLRGVEDLVCAILSPQKFSVYVQKENKLVSTLQHGWSADDPYRQVIESSDGLYQSVVGNRETLCVANQDHQAHLSRQGLIAGPIYDPNTQRVIGMLKIEQMEFVNLGLNTIETFKALCEWIGSSLVNAENYQTVKEDSVINPEHNLMTYNFFKRQSDYMTNLAKRVGFDLSMIVVRLNDADNLEDNDRMTIARQLSESVKKALRNIDLAFEYQTSGSEYSILLPATSQDGANVVRDKIANDLKDVLKQFGDNHLSFIIQSIHEAN